MVIFLSKYRIVMITQQDKNKKWIKRFIDFFNEYLFTLNKFWHDIEIKII